MQSILVCGLVVNNKFQRDNYNWFSIQKLKKSDLKDVQFINIMDSKLFNLQLYACAGDKTRNIHIDTTLLSVWVLKEGKFNLLVMVCQKHFTT